MPRHLQCLPLPGSAGAVNMCVTDGMIGEINAGLLLLYNKLRFDDRMDYGYVTINGADGMRGYVSKLFKVLTVFAAVLSFIGIY